MRPTVLSQVFSFFIYNAFIGLIQIAKILSFLWRYKYSTSSFTPFTNICCGFQSSWDFCNPSYFFEWFTMTACTHKEFFCPQHFNSFRYSPFFIDFKNGFFLFLICTVSHNSSIDVPWLLLTRALASCAKWNKMSHVADFLVQSSLNTLVFSLPCRPKYFPFYVYCLYIHNLIWPCGLWTRW